METSTAAHTWTKTAAGHYTREDGVSIQRIDGPTYRKLTGGRCYVTGVWWIAVGADGHPIREYPSIVGSHTLSRAKGELARFERRKGAKA